MSQITEKEARERLFKGVQLVHDPVSRTLGPDGQTIIIKWANGHPFDVGGPVATKDGVTVAMAVTDIDNPFEKIGADMFKGIALKTNADASDGTTTATVLGYWMFKLGMDAMAVPATNMFSLKAGIEHATGKVLEYLKSISTPVTGNHDAANIATIACNGNAEIGKMVAEALLAVGADGVTFAQESDETSTRLEITTGTMIESGMLGDHFINDYKAMACKFNDPVILIHDKPIVQIGPMIDLFQELVNKVARPVVFICEGLDGEAAATIINTMQKGMLRFCAVAAPYHGQERRDFLEDLAIITGGTYISESKGRTLASVKVTDFGKCSKFEAFQKTATFVGGAGDKEKVENRIEQIRGLLAASENANDRQRLETRLARLAGGVAVIKVGATTYPEMLELKDRVVDAIGATKAAIAEGVLPGGGVALLRASVYLSKVAFSASLDASFVAGYNIVANAIRMPIQTILENSGLGYEKIVGQLLEHENTPKAGYDARKKQFENNMITAGIIDPVKVTCCALKNAASICCAFLTTGAIIKQ